MNGCSRDGPSLRRGISRRSGLPGKTDRGPDPKAIRRSDAKRPDLEFIRTGKVLHMQSKEGRPARCPRQQAQPGPRSAAYVETRGRLDGVESFAADPEKNAG